MKKLIAAIDKFSFAQLTSNSNGKTSGSGTMGILICAVGALTFLLGCIDKMFLSKDVDILSQTIIFTGIGAALLGYRKSKDATGDIEIAKIEKGVKDDPCSCEDGCTCGNCDRCK